MNLYCILPFTKTTSIETYAKAAQRAARVIEINRLSGRIVATGISQKDFRQVISQGGVVGQEKAQLFGSKHEDGGLAALKCSFKEGAEIAVIQKAEDYYDMSGIVGLAQAFAQPEMDLVVGVRPGIQEMLRILPAMQVVYEVDASVIVASLFGLMRICMRDGAPDLLSGCLAFSRSGWEKINKKINFNTKETGLLFNRPEKFQMAMTALCRGFRLNISAVGIGLESKAPENSQTFKINQDVQKWLMWATVARNAEEVRDGVANIFYAQKIRFLPDTH